MAILHLFDSEDRTPVIRSCEEMAATAQDPSAPLRSGEKLKDDEREEDSKPFTPGQQFLSLANPHFLSTKSWSFFLQPNTRRFMA
jgi:hypothetical protein